MDTMRERFASTVSQLLDEDPRLAVVLAVIGSDGFREAERRHPHRVIDVGIREQLLVGAGGGLALAGMRPIVHTFASFLVERPFEQVKLDFGHQGVGGVLVSAGASYDTPSAGLTHMSPGDVALLDTLDGWTVQVPGHPDEAEALLRQAAKGDDRVYLRLSLQTNDMARPVDGAGFLTVREGRHGVVVAVGPMLDNVLVATEGLDTTVLYATTVRPFDGAALRRAVGDTGAAEAVIVEPYLAGTSTASATEALADVPHRVLGLGVGRRELRKYGEITDHLAAHGLDPRSLRERISGFLTGGA
ncbi:transketolase family protein [Streptomyces sp. NBC_01716]|uniref:transketolase family protein n=1 Tax=Streptomyces sp. NBC_01716 TaxID=2975917 RepID=UPI002E36A049|nr:transketolase [Streptomyces sp. NBC_01716]